MSTDTDEEKSIAYGKLIAVLVEAVKEQQQLIYQKSATITEQQDKMTSLEAMMPRLNQQMAERNKRMATIKASAP